MPNWATHTIALNTTIPQTPNRANAATPIEAERPHAEYRGLFQPLPSATNLKHSSFIVAYAQYKKNNCTATTTQDIVNTVIWSQSTGRDKSNYNRDTMRDSTADGPRTALRQVARFKPKGLLGLAYWNSVLPLHGFVFRGMMKGIKRAADTSTVTASEAVQPST